MPKPVIDSRFFLMKKFRKYNKQLYCSKCDGYLHPEKNEKQCKDEPSCNNNIWSQKYFSSSI